MRKPPHHPPWQRPGFARANASGAGSGAPPRNAPPRAGHHPEDTPSQRDTRVRIPRQPRTTFGGVIPDAAPLLTYISGTRHHFLRCGARRSVPTEAPFAYGPAAGRVRSEHPGRCGTNIRWCPWPLIRPAGRPPPARATLHCLPGQNSSWVVFCPTEKFATLPEQSHRNRPRQRRRS
jgi:hypothetical protein